MSALPDLIRKLPKTPGVYQFFDAKQNLIYVGKAKNLRLRVQSYFRKAFAESPKNQKLRAEIRDLKWLLTKDEVDALVLEANLIKQFQPKFNVLLRDDKNFLYFKLTREEFPRLLLTRKLGADQAHYFGPKTDARAVRKIFALSQKLFQVRTCSLKITQDQGELKAQKAKIPCLDYDLQLCSGPCIQKISPAAYQKETKELVNFLRGQVGASQQSLTKKMQQAAQNRQFELAAKIRDQLAALEFTRGKTLSRGVQLVARDVLGLELEQPNAFLALLIIRAGRLIETKNFLLKTGGSELPEILQNFLSQYLALPVDLPAEILVPVALPNATLLQDFGRQKFQKRIQILVPQKGQKEDLLRLAAKNAAAFAVQQRARAENSTVRTLGAAQDLARILQLKARLRRIEGYDISHLAGIATVGSLVTFLNGEPQKAAYRHFKLRSLAKYQIDDCASLVEVLKRRMSYLITQNPELKVTLCKQAGAKAEKIFVAYLVQIIVGEARLQFFPKEKFYLLKRFTVWQKKFMPESLKAAQLEFKAGQIRQTLLAAVLQKLKGIKVYLPARAEFAAYAARFGLQAVRQPPKTLAAKFPQQKFLVRPSSKVQLDAVFTRKPDLVVLDGGKPQLRSVLRAVTFPPRTAVIALAKKREEIWQPVPGGGLRRINLEKRSLALQLLQRLRDEAHRFANRLRKIEERN